MEQVQIQEEFLNFLSRCERTVFKVCLTYTDRQPDNVRDLYQEIVCNLWQTWPSFRHESSENTWVYRIALNTAAAQLRKQKHIPSIVQLTDEMISSLGDSQHAELENLLYRLIDQLNKADKALILLYLDKIPYDQIANILGIAEATARKRVERIKQKLIKLNTQDNGKDI